MLVIVKMTILIMMKSHPIDGDDDVRDNDDDVKSHPIDDNDDEISLTLLMGIMLVIVTMTIVIMMLLIL